MSWNNFNYSSKLENMTPIKIPRFETDINSAFTMSARL